MGSFQKVTKHGQTIHNIFLQTTYELGVWGLFSLLLILGSAFRSAKAKLANNPQHVVFYVYNAIFVVLYTIFKGMFHPMSVVRIEWIHFLIAVAPTPYLYLKKENQMR